MNISSPLDLINFGSIGRPRVKEIIATVLRFGLAGVLAVAGIAKLINSSELIAALQQVPFLNYSLIIWIATLLPIVEVILAILLFFMWKPLFTVSLTIFLFACFLGFSVYGLYAHMSGDCGCLGDLSSNSFGWGMVIRNLILFWATGFLWVRQKRS
jgi:hypothetical protein